MNPNRCTVTLNEADRELVRAASEIEGLRPATWMRAAILREARRIIAADTRTAAALAADAVRPVDSA